MGATLFGFFSTQVKFNKLYDNLHQTKMVGVAAVGDGSPSEGL